MPSSIATSEKKRKSANDKKPLSDNDTIETHIQDTDQDEQDSDYDAEEDENTGKKSIREIANEATEQVKGEIEQVVDSDIEEEDGDAMTTMNAIMEYNKMLLKRLEELEANTGKLNNSDVQNTVQNTLNDVSAKYNKQEDSSSTHHSFELPVNDLMKGYGCFSTEPVGDETNGDDGETTIKDGDENIVREKDDIVVKVEATKTGITFSIHIPRN